MAKFIMAIDQGTTSSRAILFDAEGNIKASAQEEFTQYFPDDGWVEHDPEEIWSTTVKTFRQVLNNSGVNVSDVAAIGVTNQRETTLIWDRLAGQTDFKLL